MSDLKELLELSEKERNKGQGLETKTNLLDHSLAEQHIENIKQDREERKKYAKWSFWFLCGFTFLVILLLFFCAVRNWAFHLSDPVLITLITTSLATVVGIFIFVMKYLFKGN